MTQAQIRKERKRLMGELKKLQLQVETVRDGLRQLERQCEHPNVYDSSDMGGFCRICPDCGWST